MTSSSMPRQDAVLSNPPPSSTGFDALFGVIADRTETVSNTEKMTRFANLNANLEFGEAGNRREAHGFDLFDFSPSIEGGCIPPNTYKGVSGGGLWRVYSVTNDAGYLIVDRRLYGVVFHETPIVEGYRKIVCHGSASIYRAWLMRPAESGLMRGQRLNCMAARASRRAQLGNDAATRSVI
jgi:hypothetical protein